MNGRITPQFSGGALNYVPWHFIHHRPLQLLVRRRHNESRTIKDELIPQLPKDTVNSNGGRNDE